MLEGSRREEPAASLSARLSVRELDVLALAAQGMTNQQIASRLAVSVHGVKFHLASIFRKFAVENRTAAVALYLSEGGGGGD